MDEFPRTPVRGLNEALGRAVDEGVASAITNDLKQQTTRYIDEVVNGARHERGFGQLLPGVLKVLEANGLKGFTFRLANQEEDLEYGADYVVIMPDGQPLYIDVKSRPEAVKSRMVLQQPPRGQKPVEEPYSFRTHQDKAGKTYHKIVTWSYLDRKKGHFVDDGFNLDRVQSGALGVQQMKLAKMLTLASFYFRQPDAQ